MGDPIVETVGREWRKARTEGVPLRLPSGNVARLRAVNLELLLKLGRIPDSLTPAVVEIIMGRSDDFKPEDTKQALDTLLLMDTVCEVAFVSPRIVAQPQADDEISIDDVEGGDKAFVFQFLNQPIRALERFHDAQAHVVDPVEPSEGDGAPSEPDRGVEDVGQA